jgi:hypothetical protein
MQPCFVARSISWKGCLSRRAAYRQHLGRAAQAMKAEGWIVQQHLYSRILSMNAERSRWAWTDLLLTELAEGVSPEAFLKREQVPAGAETFRLEVLEPTPGCYVPQPAAASGSLYSVEYIDVMAGSLNDYRSLMVAESGPAMKLLVDGGEVTTFIPLETREVILSTTPSISWNQIHIIGMKWTGPFTFQRRYDQALRRLHPERGFDSLVTQLEQICSYARMDLAMRRVMA